MESSIYDKRRGRGKPGRASERDDTNMSPDAPPPGGAPPLTNRHGCHMETAQPEGLLGLMIIVAASLVVLVYVFLRMAGVGRNAHRHGRPPPPSPLG